MSRRGDAFAQLHNLSSYMLYDCASKTVEGSNSYLKHPEYIGLILGPARGLTDTGAQQFVVGTSAALRWCGRPLKRHGLVPVDVTPTNMVATCGRIGTAKVVQVLDFLAGIVGVNGLMRFLVLEEPMTEKLAAIWTRAQSAERLLERRMEIARKLARSAQVCSAHG